MDNKNFYIVSVHSIVDYISNSSTELYVTSQDLVEDSFKEIFKAFMKYADWHDLDHETEIRKLKNYEKEHGCEFTFKEGLNVDKETMWVIDASYHNDFLNLLLRKYMNPLAEDDFFVKYNGW